MRKAPTSRQAPSYSRLGTTGVPQECLSVEVQPSSSASGDGACENSYVTMLESGFTQAKEASALVLGGPDILSHVEEGTQASSSSPSEGHLRQEKRSPRMWKCEAVLVTVLWTHQLPSILESPVPSEKQPRFFTDSLAALQGCC